MKERELDSCYATSMHLDAFLLFQKLLKSAATSTEFFDGDTEQQQMLLRNDHFRRLDGKTVFKSL